MGFAVDCLSFVEPLFERKDLWLYYQKHRAQKHFAGFCISLTVMLCGQKIFSWATKVEAVERLDRKIIHLHRRGHGSPKTSWQLLARAMPTQKNCLIILWHTQNTGGKYCAPATQTSPTLLRVKPGSEANK